MENGESLEHTYSEFFEKTCVELKERFGFDFKAEVANYPTPPIDPDASIRLVKEVLEELFSLTAHPGKFIEEQAIERARREIRSETEKEEIGQLEKRKK